MFSGDSATGTFSYICGFKTSHQSFCLYFITIVKVLRAYVNSSRLCTYFFSRYFNHIIILDFRYILLWGLVVSDWLRCRSHAGSLRVEDFFSASETFSANQPSLWISCHRSVKNDGNALDNSCYFKMGRIAELVLVINFRDSMDSTIRYGSYNTYIVLLCTREHILLLSKRKGIKFQYFIIS